MQDKHSIRARYKDISRLIFFNDQYQSAIDNGETMSQFVPSVCSGSIRSLNSTITMDSTMSKGDNQNLSNGTISKSKKKSLFRKLSFNFSRSSSTSNVKTDKCEEGKKEENA
uniref:Uncharacterized protein n=1 Tax=Strongyloides papillosus TaxID=174720 RepID=A0A0N5C8P8_STREA